MSERRGRPPKNYLITLKENILKGNNNECWEWQRKVNTYGYGSLWVLDRGRSIGVHRLVWEINYGPIPEGLLVLHECDNRKCCNPQHLKLGTDFDNAQDRVVRGRGAVGLNNGRYTKPENTARGEKSGRAKLTKLQVREIKSYLYQGCQSRDIALLLRVPSSWVRHIEHGRNWTHI